MKGEIFIHICPSMTVTGKPLLIALTNKGRVFCKRDSRWTLTKNPDFSVYKKDGTKKA